MSRPIRARERRRDPVVVGLLGIIGVLLVILIIVIVRGDKQSPPAPPKPDDEKVAVKSDQTVTREQVEKERQKKNESDNEKAKLPPPPKEIGNPRRIQEVLQEGKTYRTVTRVMIHTPVRSKDWGLAQTVTLNFVAETEIHRTIEKNDGQEIQELRYFAKCRMLKMTSKVDVQFEPPLLAVVVLGAADWFITGGEGTMLALEVKPVAEAFLTAGAQAYINEENAKVKATIESLEGKKIRVVYRDGKGVINLTPVDCTLSEEERDFLFGLSLVSDAYLLPDVESKPGDTWDVPGQVFTDILPPSWQATPQGTIRLRRMHDYEEKEKKFAKLEIMGGTIHLDATDTTRRRVGRFTPRGYATYNITDGHVQTVKGKAQMTVEEVSRDHFLFEERFEINPTIQFSYYCELMR